MKIENAVPLIFYGLHFQSGVAEYKDVEPSQMIYITSDTANSMDKSYAGKPVYVLHNSDAKHDDVQKADGVVVESFYNKVDGNNWVKFIIYTDEGLEAIKKGWTLSNAYDITSKKGSGVWHGVDYDYEVASGEYDHLAIVPNPRYADSIIKNPEDFKQYNLDKEAELARLANSKGEEGMLKFFKRKKVENSEDLEGMRVVLPKTKREVTIAQLVNEADKEKEEEKMNMSSKVNVGGDDEMSVKELVNFYKKNMKKNEDEDDDKENEDDDDKENEDEDDKENEDGEDDKENEEDDDKENEDEDEEDTEEKENKKKNMKKKKNAKKKNSIQLKLEKLENQIKEMNLNSLVDAPFNAISREEESEVIETSSDQTARGRARYGA